MILRLFVVAVVAIPLGLAILDRLRIDLAALLIAILLGAAQFFGLGVLGPAHAKDAAVRSIAGFGRPEVMVLVGLFVVMRGLDKTGIPRWIARRLLALGGQSERRLITLFTTVAAFLSLFMNNIAVGALLLPSAMDASRRSGIKPSKLLMPVAFGTILGGMATYFTTANIVLSSLLPAAQPPQKSLHILDFTPVGGLIALAGIAFMAAFARRLLPDRISLNEQLIPRYTSAELETVYQLDERLWEARVQSDSPLIGKTLAQAGIGERFGLAVIAVIHKRQTTLAPAAYQTVAADDCLLIVGREERLRLLTGEGLAVDRTAGVISARGVALVEVLPIPHSPVEGQTLKELEIRKKYGFTAVALWRDGRSYRTDVGDFKLRLGDTFLMLGPLNRLKRLQNNPDFIVLEPDTSDQPVEWHRAILAFGITAGVVIASALGFPIYLAVLAGAALVVLAKLLTMEEAYRAVSWQAVFLIAGMYSASLAMIQTGLARLVGDRIIQLASPFGPLGLAAGCFLLAMLFAQVMGSQVAALVIGPVTISAALQFHTNPQAIAVATATGCSASFLTPMAHPINTLLMGPANYQFRDFFRLGWGLTVVCFAVLILGMRLFWRL